VQLINKKFLVYVFVSVVLLAVLAGGAYAAFSDKSEVKGVTISVGSADIKLLKELFRGATDSNLADSIQGPSFNSIGQTWTADFPLKVYNNATTPIALSSTAFYETAHDPEELRSYIYVEPLDWADNDGNGIVDPSELSSSYGKKTIVKWKTEGFDFGSMATGEIKGFVLRFSTQNMPTSKQGATGVFDFEISGVAVE